MTWLFTIAALLNGLHLYEIINRKLRKVALYSAFVLMLAGSGFLVQAGHLGASLVYQQGAGVYNHSVDCDEHEE
ncbi:MAG: hypothetical protein C0490_23095 [Marivirga sp.]|nr:hypothetical protein [Marivirga sp.]